MNKGKPITPDEVAQKKLTTIPPEVIDIFNEFIATKWSGKSARVIQKEVVALIVSRLNVTADMVYQKHWLDVEPIFREAGWKVEYDKPAYCETYDAYFVFSRSKP